MKPNEYLQKRAMEREDQVFLSSKKFQKKIEKVLVESEKEVINQINRFYMKFNVDGKISLLDSKKKLTKAEFREWKKEILEYKVKIMESGNENLIKEFNRMYNRTQISRLDSLLTQIKTEQDLMYNKQLSLFKEELTETYKTSYYKSIYDTQTATKTYYSFATFDPKMSEKILTYKMFDKTFSETIWGSHRQKLFNDVQNRIARSLVTGKGNREIAKEISQAYGTSISNANRLIRTESAFYLNQATLDAAKETLIDEYMIMATLDKRTSKICREMDGRIFKYSEAIVGVNYCPLHISCRSVCAEHIPDLNLYEKRIARNKEGQSIEVDYMTYSEWEKKYT